MRKVALLFLLVHIGLFAFGQTIQHIEAYDTISQKPCYCFTKVEKTKRGFSEFAYTFQYNKNNPLIVVKETEHVGSYSIEEWQEKLRTLKKSNELMVGIVTLKNILGSVIVENNMIYFFSNDGDTAETFVFVPCSDGETERLLNESSSEYWKKCGCPMP